MQRGTARLHRRLLRQPARALAPALTLPAAPAPQETRGLTRSDDISRLLPAEAALLARGRQVRQSKLLFYAKMAEKGARRLRLAWLGWGASLACLAWLAWRGEWPLSGAGWCRLGG